MYETDLPQPPTGDILRNLGPLAAFAVIKEYVWESSKPWNAVPADPWEVPLSAQDTVFLQLVG
jgi:hypothetical protein